MLLGADGLEINRRWHPVGKPAALNYGGRIVEMQDLSDFRTEMMREALRFSRIERFPDALRLKFAGFVGNGFWLIVRLRFRDHDWITEESAWVDDQLKALAQSTFLALFGLRRFEIGCAAPLMSHTLDHSHSDRACKKTGERDLDRRLLFRAERPCCRSIERHSRLIRFL